MLPTSDSPPLPVCRRRSWWFDHGSRRVGLLLALTGAAALSGCGSGKHAQSTASSTSTTQSAPGKLMGLIPTPLPIKPSFTLRDTAGQPFAFLPATKGKLTYLFFGYTHCPDACPATMSYLAYAYHRQSPDVRRRVTVVFVTVDPRRDTGPVLRRYLDHFDKSFVGLIGSAAQVAAAERAAGLPVTPGGPKGYEAHSTFVLPYSPDGRAHVVYAFGSKPQEIAHDLPLLLAFTSK